MNNKIQIILCHESDNTKCELYKMDGKYWTCNYHCDGHGYDEVDSDSVEIHSNLWEAKREFNELVKSCIELEKQLKDMDWES